MKTLIASTAAALVIAFASPALAGAGCSKSKGYRTAAKIATPAPAPASPAASTTGSKDIGQTQGSAPEPSNTISFSQAQGGQPSKI